MPSLSDSAVIFLIALLLFGPKKLPELARYIGKLMGEFRRASAEFRLQMDDEFRAIEQADQQKKIAAMQAAAPVAPVMTALPEPEHPHMPPPQPEASSVPEAAPEPVIEPLPIASNGDLHLMPPATGLPVARSSSTSVSTVFDSIPHTPEPAETEAPTHG